MARFDGGSTSVCNAREGKNRGTAPVMSYKANAFGLYDMHGNLWEWVEDCWNPNYKNAPTDGSAWLTGNCAVKVLRGGSWDYHKSGLRSANRYSFSQKVRRPNYGFRLAHDK
jgi:formylglycine-generating enzyme required for sulfatase activity